MNHNPEKFIQSNSPDGGFLQSEEWRMFQESVGRKALNISADGFWANIIGHSLPVVGKYFYVPRGPVLEISNDKLQISNKAQNPNDQISKQIQELINLAKKERAGWMRIDPASEEVLEIIEKNVEVRFIESGVKRFNKLNLYKNTKYKIVKAPHDMQPKEIFIIDISKIEEVLLAEMKAKTRYNIRLAEKKGVIVKAISNFPPRLAEMTARRREAGKFQISNEIPASTRGDDRSSTRGGQSTNVKKENEKYIAEFLRLVKITAKRDGITSHPESYYRKMLEIIPGEILKLYIAEYEGKVIAANLVLFYGETCTYMHGASDDAARNVMAPYLLQWRQIKDAKENGCKQYDFGGVASEISNFEFPISNQAPISNDLISKKQNNSKLEHSKLIQNSKFKIKNSGSWAGITRFKTGFSPRTASTIFPGSYDVIIDPKKYYLYRFIQKIKALLK